MALPREGEKDLVGYNPMAIIERYTHRIVKTSIRATIGDRCGVIGEMTHDAFHLEDGRVFDWSEIMEDWLNGEFD